VPPNLYTPIRSARHRYRHCPCNNDDTSIGCPSLHSLHSLQGTYDTRGPTRWIAPRISLICRNNLSGEISGMCARHWWPSWGKRLHRARNAQTLDSIILWTRDMPPPSEMKWLFCLSNIATTDNPSICLCINIPFQVGFAVRSCAA
jgi:hypothetical protein